MSASPDIAALEELQLTELRAEWCAAELAGTMAGKRTGSYPLVPSVTSERNLGDRDR